MGVATLITTIKPDYVALVFLRLKIVAGRVLSRVFQKSLKMGQLAPNRRPCHHRRNQTQLRRRSAQRKIKSSQRLALKK